MHRNCTIAHGERIQAEKSHGNEFELKSSETQKSERGTLGKVKIFWKRFRSSEFSHEKNDVSSFQKSHANGA